MTAKRGWRERVEVGIYRNHRTTCRSSTDRQPGRRCRCPFAVAAPAGTAGTRWLIVGGTLGEARKARARAAAERGTVSERVVSDETLHAFAAAWFRTKAQ